MNDRKLLVAILILIGLVGWLIVISLDKKEDDSLSRSIQKLQSEISSIKEMQNNTPKPVDGHTPELGVDYFNGKDGKDGRDPIDGKNGLSAYEIAVKNGFFGTEADWLESLRANPKQVINVDVDIECRNDVIYMMTSFDTVWRPTNVKCEAKK